MPTEAELFWNIVIKYVVKPLALAMGSVKLFLIKKYLEARHNIWNQREKGRIFK